MRMPEVVVRRLPVYLRVLQDLLADGVDIVSSGELSQRTGFSSEQIRKDFAYFRAFGTRGVGYRTRALNQRLRRALGLDRGVRAVLVGVGNLGTALVRHFLGRRSQVFLVAAFDSDPSRQGLAIDGLRVLPMEQLGPVVAREGVKVGVLTVPAGAAQKVGEALVAAGIEAILNFSPVKLRLDPRCHVQNIDLTIELESLSYYASGARGPGRRRAPEGRGG
ncbi:MAG: redox-sensing transcriptional repressor Rex [Acetobacteraceae bacterium]|nr:redox-sensing transcriptional repressor Rex [Acetobacteraceae bacterium]